MFFFNDPVSAYERDDFLRLIYNTDECFVDCYAILEVSNPSAKPILLDEDNWRTWFVRGEGGELVDGLRVEVLDDVEYVVSVPVYANVSHEIKCDVAEKVSSSSKGWCYSSISNMSNLSSKVLVWSGVYDSFDAERNTFSYKVREEVGSRLESRVKKDYVDFVPSGFRVGVGEVYRIRISGKKKPKLGVNNVDWRIKFLDYEPGWAWWNSSFEYRRNLSCENMDDRVPLVVNGSGGFSINGHNQVIWSFCSGSGSAVYFNDETDYIVVNDTHRLPMEVEKGMIKTE